MSIWSQYLLKSLLKTFLLILMIIFFMYTFVDLSINGVRFLSTELPFFEVAKYYVYSFFNLHAFFFPLVFLFSSLKLWLDLNRHNELIALQMAGISQKKLLTPFFIFATFLVLASYSYQEWFSPITQNMATTFRTKHSKHKKKNPHLYHLAMQNQSELIYQRFENDQIFDVFWLKNNKDIWHIKNLKLNPSRGEFVDHFQRTKSGEIEKKESFSELEFPQIAFAPNMRFETFTPLESRPITTLLTQSLKKNSERKNVLCQLHYTLATPLICFLLIFAISPFAFQFSRSKNGFLIVALSLFGFVAFRTILDGMLILGESQILPSYVAIWGPMVIIALITLPKFVKV